MTDVRDMSAAQFAAAVDLAKNRMTDSSPLLTTAQAAAKLSCHPQTLRRAVHKGTLTCFRVGYCLRFSAAHLQAYLDQRPAQEAKG